MQRALNENYFLCVQNKLIIMAGAETSWQGIERPQCGQHRLLSFARIIAVVTVAVVAKCFSVLFSFVILFVFGGFLLLFCFSLHVFVWHTISGQILPLPWSQGCPL